MSDVDPTLLQCPEKGCPQSFKDEGPLVVHLEKNHPCSWTFPCQFCPQEFNNSHSLIYHIRSRHNEALDHSFKCTIKECAWTFQSQELLDKHLKSNHGHLGAVTSNGQLSNHSKRKTHKKNKEFQCTKCDKVLLNVHTMKNHMKLVHSTKEYLCPEEGCRKAFKNPKYLKLHQDSLHQPDLRFPCQFCPVIVKTKEYLAAHIRKFHRETKSFAFKCSQTDCGLTFSSELYLKKHEESHKIGIKPGGGANQRKCPKCDKIISKNYLKEHIANHSEGRERSWVCQEGEGCEKSYLTRRELMSHVNIFHKVKPGSKGNEFKCEICEKMFDNQRSLSRHLFRTCRKKKAEGKAVRKYSKKKRGIKCGICGKSFGLRRNLAAHLVKMHQEEEVEEDSKVEMILPDDLHEESHSPGSNSVRIKQDPDGIQPSNDILLEEIHIGIKLEPEEVTDQPFGSNSSPERINQLEVGDIKKEGVDPGDFRRYSTRKRKLVYLESRHSESDEFDL